MPYHARAGVWGEPTAAAFLENVLAKIRDQIEGVILVNIKMQAVRLMNSQLEQLIAGVNGGGLLFISDWQQYLFEMPAEANQLYVNDLLSQSTRGKCSGMNFQSVASGQFNSNYFTYLCNVARITGTPMPVVNIDQYSADPIRSIREGDWRIFSAVTGRFANNPFGYQMLIEQQAARDLAARQEAARAEAIANQGYKGVKAGGLTVTPGRTVAAMVEDVKTLSNQIIIGAQNPAELIGGLVASVANRAINQMLQRGFDKAREQIQERTTKIVRQINKASADVNKVLGPASGYIQGVNQQLGNINNTRVRTGGTPPSCYGSNSQLLENC